MIELQREKLCVPTPAPAFHTAATGSCSLTPLFTSYYIVLLCCSPCIPVPHSWPRPQPTFILQAAHAVLQQQETGKPVYKVKNVSLNTLCRSYNAPVNPRKDQVSA